MIDHNGVSNPSADHVATETSKKEPQAVTKSDIKSTTASNQFIASTGVSKPAVRSQTFIIQKYIERPLLINSRKFDIRVWVSMTHEGDVFFFREGYLRTSS